MRKKTYYNEINPYLAEWLRRLIATNQIAPGDVDERDIREVKKDDIKHYTQCHFFAGIGGWSVALRLAGWPDERPVWTGSPPCQPFSLAGKRLGIHDKRHLLPTWISLIQFCTPATVFGEQVAEAVTKDRWLDTLFDALENTGYACGAAVMPACGIGAPHKRQRVYFVGSLADTYRARWKDTGRRQRSTQEERISFPDSSCVDVLFCRYDKRKRPIASGIYPLAYGLSSAPPTNGPYGNAIVPQIAAEFISAAMPYLF